MARDGRVKYMDIFNRNKVYLVMNLFLKRQVKEPLIDGV